MSNKFTSDKKLLQVMTMNPTVALLLKIQFNL